MKDHHYPEGYTQVSGPFVQPLGLDGEHFKLKVTYEYKNTDDNGCSTTWRRGIILRFRAEDLPSHSSEGELLVKNLGPLLKPGTSAKEFSEALSATRVE